MMARENALADINQYLADTKEHPSVGPMVNPDAPNEPIGAPVPEESPASKEQQHAQDLDNQIEDARQEALQSTEQERASIREMKRAQLEADRQRAEESEAVQKARQAIEGVQDTVASGREVVRTNALRLGNAVGAIPIPGDLIVPLALLLLFFFALIPIGGHTRLMWLWLTLTGNAQISGTGGGTTTPVVGAKPGTPTTEPFPSGLLALPSFTNVGAGETRLAPLPTLPSLPHFQGAPNLLQGLGALFTGVEEIV